ncbi:MAG TPA: GNAT family N-acetyltransferase [Clostridiaceae bacterium]|nr:GNAT family N-acetyltransferase [Clostridiaceae bacterium]
MVDYQEFSDDLELSDGFFEGWPRPPGKKAHRAILQESYRSIVALDGKKIIGFITAVSDGILSACIPLLEVLPEHRGRGIGGQLVKRMLQSLDGLYMIDLACDPELQPFYEKLGFRPARAMIKRNYDSLKDLQ